MDTIKNLFEMSDEEFTSTFLKILAQSERAIVEAEQFLKCEAIVKDD